MNSQLINNLNVNHLKIFQTVYRLKSMTLAAQELHLTQSGVSQHIKKLEEDIECVLFIRNRAELFATAEADILYKSCVETFAHLAEALEKVKSKNTKELEGTIKIGVPTEFGNNVLIPALSEWAQKNSKIKFEITYGYRDYLTELLENGKVDIAFIDSLKFNRRLASEVVFEEGLSLVASETYLKNKNMVVKSSKNRATFLKNLDFIEYEHEESMLRMWFQHHFKKKNMPLNIKAWAMNVQGVSTFVKLGMGAAIMPDYVIEKSMKEGVKLTIFKGARDNLTNRISVAWLRHKPLTKALEEFKNFIIKEV